MVEKAKMENVEPTSPYYDGFCDECSQWSDRLKEIDGRMYCEDCYNEKLPLFLGE